MTFTPATESCLLSHHQHAQDVHLIGNGENGEGGRRNTSQKQELDGTDPQDLGSTRSPAGSGAG